MIALLAILFTLTGNWPGVFFLMPVALVSWFVFLARSTASATAPRSAACRAGSCGRSRRVFFFFFSASLVRLSCSVGYKTRMATAAALLALALPASARADWSRSVVAKGASGQPPWVRDVRTARRAGRLDHSAAARRLRGPRPQGLGARPPRTGPPGLQDDRVLRHQPQLWRSRPPAPGWSPGRDRRGTATSLSPGAPWTSGAGGARSGHWSGTWTTCSRNSRRSISLSTRAGTRSSRGFGARETPAVRAARPSSRGGSVPMASSARPSSCRRISPSRDFYPTLEAGIIRAARPRMVTLGSVGDELVVGSPARRGRTSRAGAGNLRSGDLRARSSDLRPRRGRPRPRDRGVEPLSEQRQRGSKGPAPRRRHARTPQRSWEAPRSGHSLTSRSTRTGQRRWRGGRSIRSAHPYASSHGACRRPEDRGCSG